PGTKERIQLERLGQPPPGIPLTWGEVALSQLGRVWHGPHLLHVYTDGPGAGKAQEKPGPRVRQVELHATAHSWLATPFVGECHRIGSQIEIAGQQGSQ